MPMLGTVVGCAGAPALPRLGTVTGGGGHVVCPCTWATRSIVINDGASPIAMSPRISNGDASDHSVRVVGRIVQADAPRRLGVNARPTLGVAIPQTFPDGRMDPRRIQDFLRRAEALGFDSAWVVEHTFGSIPALAPLELLTYAAAVTERLRLGVAVLLTALRTPVHTAKSLATLDQLSGGRLIVGVGLGGNPKVYPAFGLTAERRAARFAEGVRVLKQLWTESSVTADGEFYRLENASVQPRPRQTPHPPLWFGGHHPLALRRAVELGNGFVGAGSASTAAFAEQMKVLRGILAESGRDAASFPISKRV